MKENYGSKTILPTDVSSQLPIFQILGNQLPEKLQTPEAKKTMGKIAFWVVAILGMVLLYRITPTLVDMAGQLLVLAGYALALIVIAIIAPPAIRLFNSWCELAFVRQETRLNRMYGIERLDLSLREVQEVQKQVRSKITEVEAVRVDVLTSGKSAEKEADEKLQAMERLTKAAGEYEKLAADFRGKGNEEEANRQNRLAKETRISAATKKSEYESARELASFFAQFGNQSGKALEILKDNESAGRIYIDLLSSSIKIIRKKLDATNKMNAATKGLADIFQVKDKWQFQVAMEAVQFQISSNVAGIRRNLEFLNQSRIDNIVTQPSQDDLENFIKGLKSGSMKKLNVQQVADPSHTLTTDERVDPAFSIID